MRQKVKRPQISMYVLVREDLDITYAMTQGGHAIAEYALRCGRELMSKWNNGTLYFYGVSSLDKLELWEHKLSIGYVPYSKFFEVDLCGELTALACISKENIFKGLSKIKEL